VLMDLKMAGMYGAIRCIRQDLVMGDLPILGVSAYLLYEEKQRCLDMGANDLINKPINNEKLIAKMIRYCHGSQGDSARH
jgi:CheY-like chemotaxis protein